MTIDIDATLQVDNGGVLTPLEVTDDALSPTGVALPVLDAEARTTLLAILAALGATVTVDGEVSLDAATLAALETITIDAADLDIRNLLFATDKADVSGSTVALDVPTLAALETITVATFPADYPAPVTVAKIEEVRLLLAAETGLSKEVTQNLVYARLNDIKNAVEAIAIDADTIAIDADTINLSTDQLEAILQTIRDNAIVSDALEATAAKQDVELAKLEQIRALVAGTLVIAAVALPLPTGASTALNQVSEIAHLDVIDDNTTRRYGGLKTAVCETVTLLGDTTIYTPGAGNRVRVFWVSALTDPDQTTTPLIRVKVGAIEIYRTFAVAHWEVFEGAVNEAVIINLSEASSVAVTIHLQEF